VLGRLGRIRKKKQVYGFGGYTDSFGSIIDGILDYSANLAKIALGCITHYWNDPTNCRLLLAFQWKY
jgi:hypothetical protein